MIEAKYPGYVTGYYEATIDVNYMNVAMLLNCLEA